MRRVAKCVANMLHIRLRLHGSVGCRPSAPEFQTDSNSSGEHAMERIAEWVVWSAEKVVIRSCRPLSVATSCGPRGIGEILSRGYVDLLRHEARNYRAMAGQCTCRYHGSCRKSRSGPVLYSELYFLGGYLDHRKNRMANCLCKCRWLKTFKNRLIIVRKE